LKKSLCLYFTSFARFKASAKAELVSEAPDGGGTDWYTTLSAMLKVMKEEHVMRRAQY
jgi:hypothetical protein